MGNEQAAEARYQQGLEEHCAPMPKGPAAANCRAWYDALAGRDLDAALRAIDAALAESGDRSDFLDTKAMVHLARGELGKAHEAARQAARMSPDDVYMLWQAERIGALARRADAPPDATAHREP
jgi:tetratricopeptide (TPR) repeat protein